MSLRQQPASGTVPRPALGMCQFLQDGCILGDKRRDRTNLFLSKRFFAARRGFLLRGEGKMLHDGRT